MLAYDFETTAIRPGTPRPVYLTLFASDCAQAWTIQSMNHLRLILRTNFLTDDLLGAAFVGWNANRFDVFFVAAALLADDDLLIYPYMTKSKTIRGLRIIKREDQNNKKAKSWEFLDGIAMTGLTGLSLDKFVANFAPDFPKLKGTIDFESEEFDSENEEHKAYAMRDSECLYHAINRADSILRDQFSRGLSVTMGGTCIRIFQDHIPDDVKIEPLTHDLENAITDYVMRGGYCYSVRRYQGPVWKYDINQAYAAAMREADLPAGGSLHSRTIPARKCAYVAKLTATNANNKIPFYYKTHNGRKIESRFDIHEISETWLTSIEVEQLISEGWQLNISEVYAWPSTFRMKSYIDKLEKIRTTCEGGPSGPIGTMVKATGNHSFGKTVETIEPLEFIVSTNAPDGFLPYDDGQETLEHIFWRFDDDRKPKDYHKPQIGAFITAHVRMVLRRAILQSPDTWLYADTDCIVFSNDVTGKLDIDPKRYGAWKVEEQGEEYQIITKKVYYKLDGTKKSAKGMNVNKLTGKDFDLWINGTEPIQSQTQLNNFLRVMRGAEMYRKQVRRGTKIS